MLIEAVALGLSASEVQAALDQGLSLHRAGRLQEASDRYRAVIHADPDHYDAHYLLGMILVQTGAAEAGVELAERAIQINPRVSAAHSLLATAFDKMDRAGDALASYDRAIALSPHLASAHNNRGLALQRLRRHGEALASYDRAIKLDPRIAEFHNNRGSALRDLNRPAAALSSFEAAIALRPTYAKAHRNRGATLYSLNRPEEALASFDKAIELDPTSAAARVNRSHALLLCGRFDIGWREYEWRKSGWPGSIARFEPQRLWLGETSPAGKTLLVHAEQGLGDTIQFCRYAKLLQDSGASTILSVQRPLTLLLRTLSPNVQVIDVTDPLPRFDHHCPLLSLPLAFRTTLESIPAEPRYLHADADRRGDFEALLGPRRKPRIGIAWSGNPQHDNDHNRSIAFEQLASLVSDDADWFCLQHEIQASDIPAFEACGQVRFHSTALKGFANTAALVELMDLVISVDTSLAHLAGALGKPVWILLPFSPDWRWLLGRNDSPWYPSARLFRQPKPGDWASVVDEVRARLGARR